MSTNNLVIGHCAQTYPEFRNIIGKVPGAKYKLTHDWYSLQRRIKSMLYPNGFYSVEAEFQYNDFGLNKVDLLHFFNSISYGSTPWISTFETVVPRFRVAMDRNVDSETRSSNRLLRKAIDAISSQYCRKLIAISKSTARLQRQLMLDFSECADDIDHKTEIILPPQNSADDDILELVQERRHKRDFMRLALIGHQFFSKGGREVLRALENLRKEGVNNFRLTVVSNLAVDSYVTKTSKTDVDVAKAFIEKNKDWIDYSESLPNNEVLKIMQNTDVGLLPSYTETFGYVVLEFQSFGVPVVTTNVRAFPDINDNDCGWIIKIPTQETGEAILDNTPELRTTSDVISEGLYAAFAEVLENRHVIDQKGEKSVQRIKAHHCPLDYAKKLRRIYSEALA